MRVLVKKMDNAIPDLHYAHAGDSGVDLFANENVVLQPGEIGLVGTGIRIAVERGYEAQVRPKSGLAANHGITVLNTPGTVDSGYRGEVKVIAINHGKTAYTVEKGKKIAQMVFARVEEPDIAIVEELDETTRNDGGFGSTGLGPAKKSQSSGEEEK